MLVVCTRLVEALPEEPEKSIHELMAKTIHSIPLNDSPDKWTELLPALLVHIYFNTNPVQAL